MTPLGRFNFSPNCVSGFPKVLTLPFLTAPDSRDASESRVFLWLALMIVLKVVFYEFFASLGGPQQDPRRCGMRK